jgi:N-acyl-D-amino-acid deacylase
MTRVVLAGGRVISGDGSPALEADVTIEGGLIVSVDPHSDSHLGTEVRDVSGLIVAPGFIDVHSHADNAPLHAEPDVSKLLQGVTTEVTGNCGLSLAPRSPERRESFERHQRRFFPPTQWSGHSFGDLLAATDAAGYSVNYAPLVGHGPVRFAAMGLEARAPSAAELRSMRSHVEEALDAGAIGLSTGLINPPGRFSDTAELVELARPLHERPAIYTSHIRSESTERIAAIREAISIGRDAGVRVEISHHKAMGRAHWGEVRRSLELVQRARGDGLDIRFDVYPYTASSTALAACLTPELLRLGDADLLASLGDPVHVDRLRTELERDDWDNHVAQAGGFSGILVSATESGAFAGKTLDQIAAELGTDGAGALARVLVSERMRATMVCFAMDEGDVEAALGDPLTSIGSDGTAAGAEGMPHPRQWGTFPRVLGRYVRERGVLTLEEAVRRMTALPAETFRLPDIGAVAPGLAADLVIFDAERIADRATYEDPTRPPTGIREVLLGGVTVVRDATFTGLRAGRRIRSSW